MNSNQTEAIKFITYHSDPNALSNSDLNTINQWIAKYPYCQSLHYLAVRSAIDTAAYPVLLAQAAAISPSRSILHAIIYQPDQFISDISLILKDDLVSSLENIADSEIQKDKTPIEDQKDEVENNQNPFGIDLNQIYGSEIKVEVQEIEIPTESKVEDLAVEDAETGSTKQNLINPIEEELEERVEIPFLETEMIEEEFQVETEGVVDLAFLENTTEEESVEVFEEPSANLELTEEEIIEEVIFSEPVTENTTEDELVEVIHDTSFAIEIDVEEALEEVQENISLEEKIEKEDSEFVYPIQTDFFALNRKVIPAKEIEKKEEQTLSQYNDERMPYTFLWWLNKTRKEHSENLQPYSSFKLDTSIKISEEETAHLNQQIAENIFHLRGADDLSVTTPNFTVPFDFRKKEFQIIEKFIKEEPQIKPPAANKIDSENKAKRSSVDTNLVVSETLAKIYVEQMLYHKALEAYKKLSLKYPEKSTYFASQIKYLELKVN